MCDGLVLEQRLSSPTAPMKAKGRVLSGASVSSEARAIVRCARSLAVSSLSTSRPRCSTQIVLPRRPREPQLPPPRYPKSLVGSEVPAVASAACAWDRFAASLPFRMPACLKDALPQLCAAIALVGLSPRT